MTFSTARSVSVTDTPPLGGSHEGAAVATPNSRFERLMNESPRLCRGMVTIKHTIEFIVTLLVKTPAFRRERLQSLALALTPSYH